MELGIQNLHKKMEVDVFIEHVLSLVGFLLKAQLTCSLSLCGTDDSYKIISYCIILVFVFLLFLFVFLFVFVFVFVFVFLSCEQNKIQVMISKDLLFQNICTFYNCSISLVWCLVFSLHQSIYSSSGNRSSSGTMQTAALSESPNLVL